MKRVAIAASCLLVPLVALAGDGAIPTCDPCIDVEGTIHPGPEWQTIHGTTTDEPNREIAYIFCAVGGEAYSFSTCDGTSPGGANFNTAISIFEVAGTACGEELLCIEDQCAGGSSSLLSEITVIMHPNGGGEYIVVVDGSGSSEGDFTLAYMGTECQTPIDDVTWGRVKATHR